MNMMMILQCVLSGSEANTLKTINKKRGDLKGDEIFRPIIDPVAASGRILRQDPEGYNYPIPSPSFLQPIGIPCFFFLSLYLFLFDFNSI